MAAPAYDSALLGSATTLFSVGIRSSAGKYLTVETFGDQLNADGTALRSKQVFTLETDGQGLYSFKTHRNKYLHADLDVNAKAETLGRKEYFAMVYHGGVVTLQASSGKYVSVKDGKIELVGAVSGPTEQFEIVIDFHPQICLMTGKRFLSAEGSELKSQRATQFGRETMLMMEPADLDHLRVETRGVWSLRTNLGKYITVAASGNVTLEDKGSDAAWVAFQIHGNHLAIQAVKSGKYLTAQGAGIKAGRTAVGAKEIFQLFDSDAQICLKAFNGKYLSWQGTNLICQRDEITNEEIFMFEFKDNKWALRTINEVWVTSAGGTLSVDAKARGADELFELEHHGSKVALKSSQGKYVSAKALGGFELKSDLTDNGKYALFFYNRPQVVFLTNLRSFVGLNAGKIMTNRVLPEAWDFHHHNEKYTVQDSKSKQYMRVGAEGKVELAKEADEFILEFYQNKLALKAPNGKYLSSEQQGWLVAKADKADAAELFEF